MKQEKITINLNEPMLNEAVYSKFAGQVQKMMWMFYDAGMDIPISIIGRPKQVSSFMDSLKREKRYMDSYMKNGLNDPKTLNNRYELERSVKNFELETGLRWPFKN